MNASTWNKCTLERRNNLRKNGLHPIDDCFSNQLIENIAQTNRSIIRQLLWVLYLWDQSYQSMIDLCNGSPLI
ncbi:hypothetical protein RchiOBHm_Chr4g0402191 [Rosa chinensis]|uniref:Uncharacterized protein n=1 Tax=Rosa chinensis TaxID=74649 RepID=A0A2P6QT89_ROSCH|nr:hypothetical protein RchiOBHm_Chr4g0402191 [Rosa chinensis]